MDFDNPKGVVEGSAQSGRTASTLYAPIMPSNIDDLLSRVRELSERVSRINTDDRERAALTAEREDLRTEARRLADAGRHPRSVHIEIEALNERLDEIEAKFVTKGYAERHLTKGFSDPGAYSAVINRKLYDHHVDEIERIRERITTLREIEPREGAQ